MSPAGMEGGRKRHSALPNGEGLSPRRINAALDTIATRRCASGGPPTNGWVSDAGQGAATTASRDGCGMSSSRAMVVPPSRYLSGHQHLPSVGMFYNVRSNITQAGWIEI